MGLVFLYRHRSNGARISRSRNQFILLTDSGASGSGQPDIHLQKTIRSILNHHSAFNFRHIVDNKSNSADLQTARIRNSVHSVRYAHYIYSRGILLRYITVPDTGAVNPDPDIIQPDPVYPCLLINVRYFLSNILITGCDTDGNKR